METKDRLGRLDRLQGLLRARDTATVRELAVELGVGTRSVWRDIDVLRTNGVPIEADRGRGGGVRLARRWSLGRLNLDQEEALDILLSLALAESLRLPLLLGRLRGVRQKLAAGFSDAQQQRIRVLRSRVLIGEPASEDLRATADPTPRCCGRSRGRSSTATPAARIRRRERRGDDARDRAAVPLP